ncbi:MAG: HD-GYP domain-containing protein [Planctomycetota bacterium]
MSAAPDRRTRPREPDDRRGQPRSDPDRRLHHDALYAFARAAEHHDADTGRHVLRIRDLVVLIALELGFDADDADAIGHDAMLHDVGKLEIPAEILAKPGPLSDDERRIMEQHTICGERLLAAPASMRRAARIARHHHECWDGSGYPDGLAGEAIPLEARITTAADLLDALLAERAYKPAWTWSDALAKVQSLAGTRLDPQVVEALLAIDAAGRLRAALDGETE